jgi:hypothetical protein
MERTSNLASLALLVKTFCNGKDIWVELKK